ncbi:MAG: VOC family protein [Firmicutes bacterium]|nr:VOC family protein [Bacillota bacterium]
MYQINLIGLLVKDVEQTIEFYQKAFNFHVVSGKTINPKGEARAFIRGGNMILELTQLVDGKSGALEGAIGHIGFFVDDLESEIERLKKLGIKLDSDIPGHIPVNQIRKVPNGRIFYFRGINDELIGLIQLAEDSAFRK